MNEHPSGGANIQLWEQTSPPGSRHRRRGADYPVLRAGSSSGERTFTRGSEFPVKPDVRDPAWLFAHRRGRRHSRAGASSRRWKLLSCPGREHARGNPSIHAGVRIQSWGSEQIRGSSPGGIGAGYHGPPPSSSGRSRGPRARDHRRSKGDPPGSSTRAAARGRPFVAPHACGRTLTPHVSTSADTRPPVAARAGERMSSMLRRYAAAWPNPNNSSGSRARALGGASAG